MPVPVATPDDFAAIVRGHAGLVRATAMSILHSRADADDVVQETFLASWEHLHTIDDVAAIGGWLVTTARRRSVDRLRCATNRSSTELDETYAAPGEWAPAVVAERAELVRGARRVLAGLPATQRRCWELRHLDGLAYQEIAEVLEVPVSTVRGLLVRSRETFEREMAGWR